MPEPVLTLTTDFGLTDHYVGTMKGVILSICPKARIVDISHEIKPYNIAEGAYVVAQAYPYFPRRSVHVIVVDPGVGTARRPILMEAAGQYFVAPDNGVLSFVFGRERHKVRLLSNERYFCKPVSNTFHGRDIFAPVAAHLAAGVAPSRMGKLIRDYIKLAFFKPARNKKGAWVGQVLHVDRFGNVVTNFQASDFPDLERRRFSMAIGQFEVRRLARNYADFGPGEVFLIAGSSGYLEISLHEDSAACRLGCDSGAAVELTLP